MFISRRIFPGMSKLAEACSFAWKMQIILRIFIPRYHDPEGKQKTFPGGAAEMVLRGALCDAGNFRRC
jgi:hypothetical protein